MPDYVRIAFRAQRNRSKPLQRPLTLVSEISPIDPAIELFRRIERFGRNVDAGGVGIDIRETLLGHFSQIEKSGPLNDDGTARFTLRATIDSIDPSRRNLVLTIHKERDRLVRNMGSSYGPLYHFFPDE